MTVDFDAASQLRGPAIDALEEELDDTSWPARLAAVRRADAIPPPGLRYGEDPCRADGHWRRLSPPPGLSAGP